MREQQSFVEPKVPDLKPRGTFPQVREVECVKSGAGEHHFPATGQDPPLPSLSPDPGGAGTYEQLPGTYQPCFYLLTGDLWKADGILEARLDPIDTMLLCGPIRHMGHFDVWRECRRACVLPGQTVGPVRLIVAGLHNPPPPPSAGSTGREGGQ